MNKICTSIEQSKKLIELGIDVNTADMIYQSIMDIDSMSNSGFLDIPECYPFNEFKNSNVKPLPCWSLSALLELIPERIPGTKLVIKWDGSYYIEGRDCLFDTAIDAAFEMVCWLKENKKL